MRYIFLCLLLSVGTMLRAEVSINQILPCTCENGPVQAFEVNAFGTAGPFIFLWTGPDGYTSTEEDPEDIQTAGEYTLEVNNFYGCVTTFTQVLELCSGIEPIEFETLPDCNDQGGTIIANVNGGVPPYAYEWSDGAITAELMGIPAGTYSLTVTDQVGCSTMGEVELESFSPEIFLKGLDDAIENPTSCQSTDGGLYFRFGGPTGGTAPYTNTMYDMDGNIIPEGDYGWADLTAGIYTLLVEDANGCTAEFEIQLIADFGINLAGYDYIAPCSGQADGIIELVILSNNPYEVLWSNGETTETITGLAEGAYSVTISDGICDDIVETFILEGLQVDPLYVNADVVQPCSGEAKGSIYLSPNGGRTPYSIQWSHDPDYSAFGIHNLAVGESYCVTITDACGASFNDCYTIEAAPDITINGIVIDACPIVNENAQFPPALGSIELSVSGGNSGYYAYEWSHDEDYTGSYPTQLEPGTYCVTVTTSAGGCQATKCFYVNERPQPTIVVSDYQQCEGNDCSEAFIDITISGGDTDLDGPFTYEWFAYVDGGEYFTAETEDLFDIPGAGNYCVIVSRPGECSVMKCIEIRDCGNAPSPTIVNIYSVPISPVFPSGAIRPEVIPEGNNFSYSWTGPNGFTSSEQDLLTANVPGEYTVTVDNGCGDVATRTTLLEECTLDLTFVPISNECSAENQAPFSVDVANTSEDDRFFFFNPGTQSFIEQTTPQFDPETSVTTLDFRAGVVSNYSFAIVNQDGCGGTVSITIGESEVHAETFEFVQFDYDYQHQAYIPRYCMRATQCGDYLVGVEFISEVEITSFLDGSEGCFFNIACGETVLQTGIPGSRILTSGISETGTHCEEGEYCVGTTTMDATNYIRYILLANSTPGDHIDIPQTFFPVYLKDPISVVQTGEVEESVEIDEDTGGCRRVRRCQGEIVEESNLGLPTSQLEYRSNGTEGGICYEVTYCGSIEMSAVPTSINNEFCTIYAIVGEEEELNELSEEYAERTDGETKPVDISPKVLRYEPALLLKKNNQDNQEEEELYLNNAQTDSYIYPNPNSGICNIILNADNSGTENPNYRIVVTDLLGKELMVEQVESNRYTLDVSQLKDGYYIISIYDRDNPIPTHHTMIKQ